MSLHTEQRAGLEAAFMESSVTSFPQARRKASKDFRVPFSERKLLLLLVDSLLILAALYCTQWLTLERPEAAFNFFSAPGFQYLCLATLGGWWLLAALNDLYDVPSSCDSTATIVRLCTVGVVGALIYLCLSLFLILIWETGIGGIEGTAGHAQFALFFVSALGSILLWRLLYANLSRFLFAPNHILIIGNKEQSLAAALLLKSASSLGYEVIGYVDSADASPSSSHHWLPCVGRIEQLPRLIEQYDVDELVLSSKNDLTTELFQRLVYCQGQGVQLSSISELYENFSRRIPVEFADPNWALWVIQGKPLFNRLRQVSKRALDLWVVLSSLPILGIFLPILVLAVKLDSPGPIFYKQVRSGRGGKPFKILKFRTMVVDAEKNGKAQWASKNDPRITRVGRFLRKTRLDELPQILNILWGEMSFVGPRPERPEFISKLQEQIPLYEVRMTVKPGLTGWAQVHYEYGNTVEDALHKLQYDFYYIRHWSFWLDLYILFKTIAVVVSRKGQ